MDAIIGDGERKMKKKIVILLVVFGGLEMLFARGSGNWKNYEQRKLKLNSMNWTVYSINIR